MPNIILTKLLLNEPFRFINISESNLQPKKIHQKFSPFFSKLFMIYIIYE